MTGCGRCGSTARATQLITMMKDQHLPVDNEIYSNYLTACSVVNEINPDEPIQSPLTNIPYATTTFNPNVIKIESPKPRWFRSTKKNRSKSYADNADPFYSIETSTSSSATNDIKIDVGSKSRGSRLQTPRRAKKNQASASNLLPTTDIVDRHLSMGNSLLEYLYDNLEIDDSGDTCPQCSSFLTLENLMNGWDFCSYTEYTTACPLCNHRFVPRFVVNANSTNFVGSQGVGTPLYCELFSPWVLRKELHIATNGFEDIDGIMNPTWRNGNTLNSKLWWNMIILFKRQKLPITFLLQGSFHDKLIMPMNP